MKTPPVVPLIETERLRLRGRTLEDFPFYREMWADPVVTKYIGGKPQDEENCWSKYLRMIGHWAALGFGFWAVEEKTSGKLIGEAGFGEFKRNMTPSTKGEPEVGWVFSPEAHGKGYATEAAQAIVAWGDGFFNGARMSCIIDPPNIGSIRVAEKCGFTLTGRATYMEDEILLLHRG
ncbi:MAG: N-acetyltransferase [Hyphococcus sp.]|nr:MAG: N-acetyltransferase [Marinicaulis sp.]